MTEQRSFDLNPPATGRRPLDFYPTQTGVVASIMPVLFERLDWRRPVTILDPCCGEGSILDTAAKWLAANAGDLEVRPIGIELDPMHAARARSRLGNAAKIECADALAVNTTWPSADLILMNPPFSLAMPFVARAVVTMAKSKGTAAVLLRLAWMASRKRAEFHRVWAPDAYVLSQRPSFTGDGKTDNSEYAWFVYGTNGGGRWKVI